MRVAVTQAHIDLGEASNDEGCPVWLALTGAGVPVDTVEGDGAWIGARWFPFPTKVFAFIKLFDKHESVAPFEFEFQYA